MRGEMEGCRDRVRWIARRMRWVGMRFIANSILYAGILLVLYMVLGEERECTQHSQRLAQRGQCYYC
jgi:hypothetical protein